MQMTDVGLVQDLKEVRPILLGLAEKEEVRFAVAAPIDQDAASKFAFDVNQERDGHVWIEVEGAVCCAPTATTLIHAWCTS